MVVNRLVLLLAAIFISPNFLLAAPINPNSDFSAGLTDWSVAGDVAVVSGEAVLSDPNGGGHLLQSINTGPGSFTLKFDLFNGLVPDTDPKGFSDLAQGTLYFSNSPIDLINLSGNFAPLFDVDSNGLFLVSLLQSVSLGGGWFQYTLAFQTAFSFVAPTFDLFDYDAQTNSILKLDNVKIEATDSSVPEPASLVLLAGALPIIRRKTR